MTAVEQHRMVQELKSRIMKMMPQERKQFEAIAKRDKDDEDLDVFAAKQLQQLHGKYFPKKSKIENDDAWAKFMKEKL